MRIESLPRHRVIPRTTGVIHRGDNLRYGRTGHRLHHACTGPNDTGALRISPNHEPRNVLNVDERSALAFGVVHEILHFARRLSVYDPADSWSRTGSQEAPSIRDDTDRMSGQRRICAEQLRRILRLELEHIA